MKSLAEFNKNRYEAYDDLQKSNMPKANGIACPSCGEELWDTNPKITLTSYPPKKNVHCPKCGYSGYRLA